MEQERQTVQSSLNLPLTCVSILIYIYLSLSIYRYIYIYPFLYFPSFYHPHIFLSASLLPPNPATPHPLCSPCCQLSSSSLSIFSSHHTNSSLEGRSLDIMNLFPKPAVLWIQTVPQIAASDPLLFTVTMETLDSPPHPQ